MLHYKWIFARAWFQRYMYLPPITRYTTTRRNADRETRRGIDHGDAIRSLERSNEADFPKRATRDFTGVNSNRAEPSIGARSRQDKWPCARSTSKPALFSQLCGVSIDPSVHLSPGTTWLMDHTRAVRAFARLPPDRRSSPILHDLKFDISLRHWSEER